MKPSYYILLLILLVQASCKKNHDQSQPLSPDTSGNKEEKYVLLSISYTPIAGNGAEEITEQRPNLEYANRSQVQQKVVIDPDGIFERSIFKRNSQHAYTISSQNQMFGIPLEIQNNQISLGAKKWEYAEQEIMLPTELKFKDSIYVEPGKKLVTKLSIIYHKIQAAYTAQLKEQYSGKLVSINGIWTGIYPYRKTLIYSTETL